METVRARIKPEINPVQSVYDYVGNQFVALIPLFGLESQQSQIIKVYEEICWESLAFPMGKRPSGASRINQDGMPFQYALTLGSTLHSLQFIGEAGPIGQANPVLSGAERIRINLECLHTVARRLQAVEALNEILPLLDVLAPATDVNLLMDPAGAIWIGAAFAAGEEPAIRIYINAAWGDEQYQWIRLRSFASFFGLRESWKEIESQLTQDLKPLGTAITISAKGVASGRIYLTAYGKRASYYEGLAEVVSGSGFRQTLQQFAKCILGDDYIYPTQTAVCSFAVGESQSLDFKFELCAHCRFASDVEAESRLQSWFSRVETDPVDYRNLLGILTEGQLNCNVTELHSYVGVGIKNNHSYSSVFLKPRLIPEKTRPFLSDAQ